jgi:hypothetical protein
MAVRIRGTVEGPWSLVHRMIGTGRPAAHSKGRPANWLPGGL